MKTVIKRYFCFGLILLMVIGCKTSAVIADRIPVHQSFVLESKILGEKRIINVWLPENYETSSHKFAVLYMPDGGIKEDFPHVANTLSRLINMNKIPPVILVGIENTQRRRDLTGPTDIDEDKKIAPVVSGSKEFRAFIGDELFPLIKEKYRITEERGIIGESLAGLFVVETFLKEPQMFNQYIAFDPSLWWNAQSLSKSADKDLEKFPQDKKRLWFAASGTEGVANSVSELEKSLKTAALPNLKWNFSPEPKETHGTIFRAAEEKALIWTFGKN